jgi:diguanylate cyclase (GGDEF)-like protein/PAS domain S-box-containing protein
MLNSLSELLKLHGFQVDISLGGREATRKLASNRYDLLLTDMKMPCMSGIELLQWINNNSIDVLSIVISGTTSFPDISQALRCGAYDYIKKPYEADELIATVNNALQKKQLENSHKAIQEQLSRSEKLHRFIVNNSPDVIFILDQQQRFSFINAKMAGTLGYGHQELIGEPISKIFDDEDLEKGNYFVSQANLHNGNHLTTEICLKPKTAERSKRHFEFSLWPIDNSATNQKYCTYGTAREITERVEAEAFINFQAYHDLLTRLPNRSLFKDRLSVAITQAQRNKRELAVMFIDLDRFKIINDSLGHTMGDRLLQVVSQRLQQCIRKGDTLSRFGGDEFTLLLPDISSQDDAIMVAEKILEQIKQPFQLGEHEVYIGASIGIAPYPDAGTDMDALIKHADIAMYRVKKSGKDGYRIFSNELTNPNNDRLLMEHDLRRAIDSQQFEVCYQPQVNTHNKKVCGVEVLVRWMHPTMGRIPPSEFIPIAEDSQLIVELDKLTLRKACEEMRQYQLGGMPNLKMSMNLSPVMVEKPDFVENTLAILHETGFPNHLLELEITENLLMNDRPEIIEKLLRLSATGIRLAIDDFGTGYSSLSYLQKFPVNTLKIDRSFINNIKDGNEDSFIVNAIIAMGKGLKMSIVAEGVETREQYNYLEQLGCEVVQGYLFGKADELQRVADMVNSELSLLEEASSADC